jgi:propionyl-CoA synthetase
MNETYEAAYAESIDHPARFWNKASEGVAWYRPPARVLNESLQPFYKWFAGGELNTCYNCVDRHVEAGKGDRTAIIYDSPVTGTVRRITYGELLESVSRFAGVLTERGVRKGETVVIYMPMIPEALVAMLACARIGAVHSVVFGGFAPRELAVRIDDARPKLVISASCGIEGKKVIEYKPLLDRALVLARHPVTTCIIYQRSQSLAPLTAGRDFDWEQSMEKTQPANCVPLDSTDPLYILYTSGTTGIPKGVVRDNGGHAVALCWSMKHIYGVDEGQVYWAASDIGWVVGHSYIVYGPLLAGCTSVLYEGKPVGTPDAGAFWRVVSEHDVNVLFTAPTALRAIKKEDPGGAYCAKYDLSSLKYLFLAGERLDPDTYYWASRLLKKPVIDHWWQTETGWAITGNCMGVEKLPVKAGSATKPVPGYRVEVLDEKGHALPAGKEGIMAIRLPLPPGTLTTLWKNDERFKESYLDVFPGYYFTGDGGYFDSDGYIYVMGRVDDVINVAGHRLSTGAMEEVVARHPDVAECAVVGMEDDVKGQLPMGFVVLKAGVTKPEEAVVRELAAMVRDQIGAIACFKDAMVVPRLPKTRSGKILRGILRKITDRQPYTVPSTIEDADTLREIEEAWKARGKQAQRAAEEGRRSAS